MKTVKIEGSNEFLRKKTKSNKRKVIRRIIRKRISDGSFIPVEVTKTVIERDGSKSITRIDPEKYGKRSHSF